MQTENQTKTTGGRFDYVAYDDASAASQAEFKRLYQELATQVERLPAGRAASLALTKLEESYMWVGKSLRDDQIKRNGSADLLERRSDS